MHLSNVERRVLYLVVGGCIVAGITLSLFFAFSYITMRDSTVINLRTTVDLVNSTVAHTIDNHLEECEKKIQSFVQQMNTLSDKDQQTYLKEVVSESPFIALSILKTPTADSYSITTDTKQIRNNHFDLPETNSIHSWTEPYFSVIAQDWVVAYGLPLKKDTERLYGLVPLSFFKKMLSAAGSSVSHYNVLTAADGTIITYQLASVLPSTSSLFDLLELHDNQYVLNEIKTVLNGSASSVVSYKDARIGQSVYLQARALHAQSWRLVTVLYPEDLLKGNILPMRHSILLLSLSILITMCLIFFMCGLWAESFTVWWVVVSLVCCACIGQLLFLWYLATNQPFQKNVEYLMIADNTQLQAFLAAQNAKSLNTQKIKPVFTGVYLEEMLFSREASGLVPFVKMSGYIWQRYTNDVHGAIKRDFLLPDGFELEKELIQTQTRDGDEWYTWRFACKHYETVTLLTYPFDHRHVSLRIIHPDIFDNVVIVPDFSSYEHINPQLLPGIGSTVLLSNWNIYSSFFYYKPLVYTATLGLTRFPSVNQSPQMCFSLVCQRTAIGELMSYLILILMSAIILFILLLSFSKHAEYAELMGFTNLNILTVVSGLLFVLIISQISLRENLDISGISYIESFYFIMYFLIVGISIDSILFICGRGGRLIQYQHNLLPKLIYWPLFFMLSLIATVVAFY